MPVWCLSIHAPYRCHHSGECCSGVFAIPAEPQVVRAATALGLEPPAPSAPLFVRRRDASDTEFLAALPDGACVFFEAGNGRLCTIHRRAGTDALPSACRHFPRIYLRDARGSFLSLSHFCPSAAALLLVDGPLMIVEAGPPLALEGAVEAFDATDALPPLLRQDLVMDLEAYDAWEGAAIATLAREDLSHDEALALIGSATETLRRWQVGEPPLASCVGEAFRTAGQGPLPLDRHERDAHRLALLGRPARVDAAAWQQLVDPVWQTVDWPVKRFLAGKLFGNRIAYESCGLRSIVEWLRLCLALLRHEAARLAADAGAMLDRDLFVEAIRAADLTLVHRLDTQSLARRLEPLERQR